MTAWASMHRMMTEFQEGAFQQDTGEATELLKSRCQCYTAYFHNIPCQSESQGQPRFMCQENVLGLEFWERGSSGTILENGYLKAIPFVVRVKGMY